jgi:hypothetical protein
VVSLEVSEVTLEVTNKGEQELKNSLLEVRKGKLGFRKSNLERRDSRPELR